MTQMLEERILIHFSIRHAISIIGVGKIKIIFPIAFLPPILIITTTTPNTRTMCKQVAGNHSRAIVVFIFVFILAHLGQQKL
jgi:hypothetical protein